MNATSTADGAGPARWVFGLSDRRILSLGRFVRYEHALPSIGPAGLQARGCEVTHFEDELGALSPHLATGWASMRPPRSGEVEASVAMVTGMALEALIELDAASVLFGVVDLALLDESLAAPLRPWQRQNSARPDQPSMRTLASAALGQEQESHLLRTLASAAACLRLATERAARRSAMRELGAALDQRSGATGPVAETALALACRAREAVALGEILADPRYRGKDVADGWRETTIAVSSRLAATLDAVHALVGMEH